MTGMTVTRTDRTVAPDRNRWAALALLCSAFVMTILDIAILTTIAVQRTTDLLAGGATPPVALTAGFQSGYTAGLVFPAIGLLVALLLLKGARRAAAAPSPAPNRRQGPAARHLGDK